MQRALRIFPTAICVLGAVLLTGLLRPGIAVSNSPANPASVALVVTVPNQHKGDEYLTSCQEKSADGWLNCLAKVRGDGGITTTYAVKAENVLPRGIIPVGDYRMIHGKQWFFNGKVDPNGTKTWESCNLSNSGQARNCFSMRWLDSHDLLEAENGDRIYMFYVPRTKQKVWLSGKALDLVLRRINANNEVIWEWSSADHFIADVKDPPRKNGFASEAVNWIKEVRTSILTNLGISGEKPICVSIGGRPRCLHMHWVDFLHANSLAWDRDGGIVVSARYINTVFKIDYPTGKVAWKLGGYHAKQSDFKLIDDPVDGFSYQHSAHVLSNGNILLFDNANNRPDQHTRAAEYKLDMERKTATLVWSYAASRDFPFRDCCGLVQRLKNGNTLIAWGGTGDKRNDGPIPIADEVTTKGETVFELWATSPMLPYRVWKIEN